MVTVFSAFQGLTSRLAFVFSAIIIAGTTLSGCASINSNYKPSTISISSPALGAVETKSVGEELVIQSLVYERDAILLKSPASTEWLKQFTFHEGHYLKIGGDSSHDFYQAPSSDFEEKAGRMSFSSPSYERQFVGIAIPISERNKICAVTVDALRVCANDADFSKKTVRTFGVESFQQTLIYDGRVGGKINIGYREYSGNRARPAFNNNVEYDLLESKFISYREAQLEILAATNQSITYRLIKNFSPKTTK
jgi:hypothetical protein